MFNLLNYLLILIIPIFPKFFIKFFAYQYVAGITIKEAIDTVRKINNKGLYINMFIQTETTPNPASLKFLPGRVVMERGTADFRSVKEANSSLLAQNLFKIEGVEGVFFGSDFISITKSESFDWQILKPSVLGAISVQYESGASIINKIENTEKNSTVTKDSEIVVQIKELLDTKVRPAVAMDGGDITFGDYKDGIVFLHMKGACSGCPSSTATLKTGIENMLKHYLPEVQGVEPVMD